MEVVYGCCCGVDGQKESVTACVLWAQEGKPRREEKRKFGTFTRDLLMLADWLRECGLTHVAMASTGGLLETGVARGHLAAVHHS